MMARETNRPPLRSILPGLPPWVRILNAAGRTRDGSLLPGGWFSSESIVRSAVRSAGLADFGGELDPAPLRLLTGGGEGEPPLTLFGRLLVRRTLVKILVNRLLIQAEVADHPETTEVPIVRPLFVVGMPRTGTTLLQRLLAQTPGLRPLLCWEAMYPAPAPRPETRGADPRRRRVARELRGLHAVFPELAALHQMETDTPEECEWLLQNSLLVPGFVFEFPEFPGFNAWCRRQDRLPAYIYYRLQLQILQRNFPPTRWILKGNEHLNSLDALLTVFPDASVILTHRDPTEAVASYLSFYLKLMGLKYDPPEEYLAAAVPAMVEEYARTIDRADLMRRSADPARFIDISYPELLADPLGAIHRIAAKFGLENTPAAGRRMRQWLADNPQGRHGVHRYSLEQFGLAADDIRKRFSLWTPPAKDLQK